MIQADALDKVTEKYFAKMVSKHAQSVYTVGMASGEAYMFSQVDTLLGLDKGLFRAEGAIYYTGSGDTPDPHGTPADWKKAGEIVRTYGTFSGVIQKIFAEGKERYVLLEYTLTTFR